MRRTDSELLQRCQPDYEGVFRVQASHELG